MHASALCELEPFLKPGKKALDIGCGSGYLTHVIAEMVAQDGEQGGKASEGEPREDEGGLPKGDSTRGGGGGGLVVGLDHIPALTSMTTQNLARSVSGARHLDTGLVRIITADGRLGCPEFAPYDAIHVGAAAVELHDALIGQLNSPGRMFIPVEDGDRDGGQWIHVIDKDANGAITDRKLFGVRYVPLTDVPAAF